VNSLKDLARASAALRRRAEASPLDSMRWLPLQDRFLRSTSKYRLIRAGNQSQGKSTCGIAEILWHCLGSHPHKEVSTDPQEWWLITASWSQSIALQAKLWSLCPKDQVHPDQKPFDPVRGLGGHQPTLRLANGSLIRIKTSQQGGLSLAGATIDGVLFDEPPRSPRVFSEVSKRVQARNGHVLLALTPINAPVDWLREACESGMIEDIHSPLTPEAMIPVGTNRPHRLPDGTVCDEAWINRIRAETLPLEVPVVVDGEWECRLEGRYYAAFISDPNVEGTHVSSKLPKVNLKLAMGIDHGVMGSNQCALLVAIDESKSKKEPEIWVLDETPDPKRPTTPSEDAEHILSMLKRWNLRWQDLDAVWGDVPAGIKGSPARRGNRDIGDAIARSVGKKNWKSLRPKIGDFKKGGQQRGAVSAGSTWLHNRMIEGRFHVHPGCEELISCLDKYDGAYRSPYIHRLDALRYACRDWWMSSRSGYKPTIVNG